MIKMILYPIWRILKRLLFRLHLLAPYSLTNRATWALVQYFFASFSFFIAVCLYFAFYYYQIPVMEQSAKLYLYKTEYGYFSRVFSFEGNFPICKETHFQGSFTPLSHEEMILQKTCANPIDLGLCQLSFGHEQYEITLKLALPETAQNFRYGEVIPIFAEFISKDHKYIITHTEAIIQREKLSLEKIIKGITNIFSVSHNELIVEVSISERFVNRLFDLNVINIEIKHPKVVVKSGTIEAKIILSGYRWIMHDWFWTTMIFSIGTIMFWVFVSLNVIWRQIKRLMIKSKIAAKRRPNDAVVVKESISEQYAEENNFKDKIRTDEKTTMDSYLKKIN